jgi:anti-anti-sigma factor
MGVTVAGMPTGVTVSEYVSWVRSREGVRTLLTVDGELDFACAGTFAATLAAVAGDGADVILDMAGVAFIDAAALDAIAGVRRFFEILGVGLTVRAPSRPVRRLLALRQLDGLIERPAAMVTQMFSPTRPEWSWAGTQVMFGS